LERIGCPPSIIEAVLPLVREHLIHPQRDISPRLVRRLAFRLAPATIEQLRHLVETDMNGRPPLAGGLPDAVCRLGEIANELKWDLEQPRPLILGRHLIALGRAPDIWFRDVLRACFEAQLEGNATTLEDGRQFLEEHLRQFPLASR